MRETPQHTLSTRATMRGRGLHTGEECEVTLAPSGPDTGIVFVTAEGEIPANVRYVHDTQRGTSLRRGDAEIHTVEHLLAALYGLQVDNVRAEVTGSELPAADGSALPFVQLIESAGTAEQDAEAQTIRVEEPVWVTDSGKYLLAVPGDGLKTSVLISFQHRMIGEQAFSLTVDPVAFKERIAPARTFCTADEIEFILSQGLGKGGAKENVVIAYDDHYSVPLRFPDELARHKVLDLIGDLSLIGGRLHADVAAIRPGHMLNTTLADRIARKGWQGG